VSALGQGVCACAEQTSVYERAVVSVCANQGVSILKHRNRGLRKPHFYDSEFTEALRETPPGDNSHQGQLERKTRQYCRQVQRALNLALAEVCARDGWGDVFVEEVSPAPDCGRLLVCVAVPPECAIEEALRSLREIAPSLRAEVAAAITRKRAPELYFVPACEEGGEYE